MMDIETIYDEILNGHIHYLRNVSIDNVIFGYHKKELKVLLQRPQGFTKWTVSGGYIKRTETIEEAASRIAKERTGLKDLYLKQFKAFGNPDRTNDASIPVKLTGELGNVKIDKGNWMLDYFVTIGFYTLTEFDLVRPCGEFYTEECQWWNIHNLPSLMFDHQLIIEEALKALRLHIYHYPIGYELLPSKFTLPEITSLYETILGKKLDDRNFSKKLAATGIIIKLNERRNIGPHRSPFLYVFNRIKYEEALKNGMVLAI
ncbi:MAG: NUDIX domain-containing protein [Bacteroidales bacterium]